MVRTTARNRRQKHGTTAMAPDRKRRDLFLALIDALLEHVQMNTRMDIRDRIAALALVDRVLAREKSDVDAERAGSKVRQYATSFQATARTGQGGNGTGSAEHDEQRGAEQSHHGESDDADEDGDADERDDAGIPSAG